MAFKTTIKVALLTGAAKDDTFTTEATGLSEDMLTAFLNVLANDPGSAQLYSLQQDLTGSGQMAPVTTAFSALGATITIQADGTIGYDALNIEPTLTQLAEGEFATDTFVYTVRMANGALSTAVVTLEIAGVNDAPTLQSIQAIDILDTAADDTPDEKTGTLVGADVDNNATLTYSLTDAVTSGTGAETMQTKMTEYGTMRLYTNTGEYFFVADPDKIDSLVNRTEVVNFTVMVTDEHNATASQTLRFNLVGANDTPIIQNGGVTTADIYELASSASGANSTDNKFATGSFVVKDLDLTNTLTAVVANGSTAPRGALTATVSDSDADGNRTVNWSYKYTDAALNSLNSGVPTTESFDIRISDATETVSQSIVLSLHGANDLSFDTRPLSSSILEITEGATNERTYLHTYTGSASQSGGIEVNWVADAGNSPNLGYFTTEMTSDGQVKWSYSVSDKYLDYLQNNEIVTQQFFVNVTDFNTTLSKEITINLRGRADTNEMIDTAGDGPGTLNFYGPNLIVRGLDGNDYFFDVGFNQHVYGDDGDDNFYLYIYNNSLIRGGNGNDTLEFTHLTYQNEIFGDNGDDLFEINGQSENQLWGGPGTDTYKIGYQGYCDSVVNDFDIRAPEEGGDKIDLSKILNQDWTTLNLLESTTVDNHYLLTVGTGLSTNTLLTIVGTNLALTDLTDGNLIYNTV